jgi:membrane protein insertase Oxa1/YidC/SpoIIIJ
MNRLVVRLQRNILLNNNKKNSFLFTNDCYFNKRFQSTDALKKASNDYMISDLSGGNIVPKIGSLFSESPVIQNLEEILIKFHDLIDLNWSLSIIITTVLFRLAVCLPLRVYQEKLRVKQIILQPVIKKVVENKIREVGNNMPYSAQMKQSSQKIKYLVKKI